MKRQQDSGQVALIMVLIMTVISAVAVSVASRTTVQTRVQQMNMENTQAILTAQAGLEDSIAKNAAVTGSLGTGQYSVTMADSGVSGVTSEKINPGEGFEVNMDGAASVTGVKIYWNSATAAGTPAIFVTDVRDSANVDYAYDTAGTNGFTKVVAGGSFGGTNFGYVSPIINTSSVSSKKLRITVLESPAFLAVEPIGGLLPAQFSNFRSVANVTSTNQNVVKYGIDYVESKTNQLPSVFDYALFSGGSIVQ